MPLLSYLEDLDSQIPAIQILHALGWKYLSHEEALSLRGGRLDQGILTSILEHLGTDHVYPEHLGTDHAYPGTGSYRYRINVVCPLMFSALKFVTPAQRHRGEDGTILEQRQVLYHAAKAKLPERWSGPSRNWEPERIVYLNPGKPMKKEVDLKQKAA